MKKSWVGLIFLMLPLSGFGLSAKLDLQINGKDVKVTALYQFEGDSARITLPRRARLTSVSSPGKANVSFFMDNNNVVRIDRIQMDFGGTIQLVYQFSINDPEFAMEDWRPQTEEKGRQLVKISVPEGYRAILLPYVSKGTDGFEVESQQKCYLTVGRYQIAEDSFENRHYSIYYQFKSVMPLSNVVMAANEFSSVLGPIQCKEICLVAVPSLGGNILSADGRLFILLNSTGPDEIKRQLASAWVSQTLPEGTEWNWAVSDFLKRLLDERGKRQTDDAAMVVVPGLPYYQKVLEEGFPGPKELNCDVNSMLKNYALLHFAYYTVGVGDFSAGLRKLSSPSQGGWTNFESVFSNRSSEAAIHYTVSQLLPVARVVPDLSLKGNQAFRSHEALPDVELRNGGVSQTVVWGNRRGVMTAEISNMAVIDPASVIPQLNFANDKAWASSADQTEVERVKEEYLKHRHYLGESPREILNVEKLTVGAKNAFGLPANATVYVVVGKFFAPINGKLVIGLKEVIYTIAGGKPQAVADRVRL